MLCSYVSKCLSVNCLKTHSYMNGILMKTYIGSCNLEGLISLFRVNSFLSLINFSPAIILIKVYVSSIICTCTLHEYTCTYSQDSPEEGGVLERDWLLIVGETPSPTPFFHDCGIKHFLPYCTNTLHPLPQEGLYVNH